MNKKHLGTVFASILVSSLMSPVAPINAMDEYGYYEQATITNGSEFVEAYAKYQMVVIDEWGQESVVSCFYTEVTRDNYGIILLGKQVYDQLPEEVRAEIEAIIVENTGIPYGAMVETAYAINAEVFAEEEAARIQAEEEAARIQAELEAAQAEEFVGPVVEEQPEQTTQVEEVPSAEEAVNEEVPNEENTEAVEENVENTEDAEEEIVVEQEQSAEVSLEAVLFSADSLSEPEETKEETAEPVENLVMNVAEPETKVEENLSVDTSKVTTITEAEQTTTVTASSGDQSNAQNFVNTYCTASGSIIQNVTTGNYQILLSGYNAWNQLTTSEKNEVNLILTKAGSQTFAKLYNTARTVNGTSTVSYGGVRTSVSTSASLYSLLCVVSATIVTILFKRKSN